MERKWKELVKQHLKRIHFLLLTSFGGESKVEDIKTIHIAYIRKLFLFLFVPLGIVISLLICNKQKDFIGIDPDKGGFEAAVINYKDEIDKLAEEFDIPSSYLMALIILECSGKKDVKPRFEEKIYDQLIQIKNKELDKLENISYETIHDATDGALRNLASSWGPFQLMGYKCVQLGVKLEDIRGNDALFWGVKWINMNYGDYLRKKKFRDAFHIHNTGKEYPADGKTLTYDPEYVDKGLIYMKYFERLDSLNNLKK